MFFRHFITLYVLSKRLLSLAMHPLLLSHFRRKTGTVSNFEFELQGRTQRLSNVEPQFPGATCNSQAAGHIYV